MEDFEIIKKIVEMVFEKAEKDSLHTKKHALAKHISDEIYSIYRMAISEKSIVRYFNKFVEGRNEEIGKPSRENLDLLCNYIGYENYINFYHKEISLTVEKEEKEEKEENHEFTYSSLNKRVSVKWIIFSLFLLLGGSVYVTNKNSIHSLTQSLREKTIDNECMYWNGEKYTAALCDRSIKNIEVMDTLLLNNFKKITNPDTITERSLGKIWYGRDSNRIEFFTFNGKHPTTGKKLKLLTPYMINKYISK